MASKKINEDILLYEEGLIYCQMLSSVQKWEGLIMDLCIYSVTLSEVISLVWWKWKPPLDGFHRLAGEAPCKGCHCTKGSKEEIKLKWKWNEDLGEFCLRWKNLTFFLMLMGWSVSEKWCTCWLVILNERKDFHTISIFCLSLFLLKVSLFLNYSS